MSLGEDLILYHAVILGKIKVTIRIAQNTGLQQPTFSPAYKVSRWNISRLCSEVYHNLPQSSSEDTSAKDLTKFANCLTTHLTYHRIENCILLAVSRDRNHEPQRVLDCVHRAFRR